MPVPKKGAGESPTPIRELQQARLDARATVADVVAAAMVDVGQRQLSRRVGRDMGSTIRAIYSEARPVEIDTLADIATATGYRLVIGFVKKD